MGNNITYYLLLCINFDIMMCICIIYVDMDDVRIEDMSVWPPMIDVVVFDSGSTVNTVRCVPIQAVDNGILEAQEDFVISVTMITSDAMSNVMSPTQNAIFRITDNEGINYKQCICSFGYYVRICYNVKLILNNTGMYNQCETKMCYYLIIEYKINCTPVYAEIYSFTKNVLVVIRKSLLMNIW